MSKKSKAIALVKQSADTGLKANVRSKLAEKIGRILASNYVLMLKTQNCHWNVTGPQFHALHVMFEEQYTELFAANDVLAERIRALGHFTPATYREFGKLSFIKEEEFADAQGMLKSLLADHEKMAGECRMVMEAGEEAGDGATHDLMIERLDIHEKTAWMIRATLG